ncbi:MAG: 23S rRNA (pseudouridine(1915)-N(3))-methyltransferase RlmH [bacterium]|nr:23S rRNA (pseudouridine(1915)-N(3))-methyltransferase RlmH [bacterium]
MGYTLVVVGKMKSSHPLKGAIEEYCKRLSAYTPKIIEVDLKKSGLTPEQQKAEESFLIQKALPNKGPLIALDEKGKQFTSRDFSDQLALLHKEHGVHLTFIIGGADGLEASIVKKAGLTLSLGKGTWPHMMVRLLLLEQIYRAHQILSGHPYHRD